jgi:hypothetical protein
MKYLYKPLLHCASSFLDVLTELLKPYPFFLTGHSNTTGRHPVVSSVFANLSYSNNMRLEHQLITKLEPVPQEVKRCCNNMLKLYTCLK